MLIVIKRKRVTFVNVTVFNPLLDDAYFYKGMMQEIMSHYYKHYKTPISIDFPMFTLNIENKSLTCVGKHEKWYSQNNVIIPYKDFFKNMPISKILFKKRMNKFKKQANKQQWYYTHTIKSI